MLTLTPVQGTIPGQRHSFQLDASHAFEAGKPEPVCGNTAAMLGEGGRSWLAKHFEVCAVLQSASCLAAEILPAHAVCAQVRGDRSVHYGVFGACSPGPAAGSAAAVSGASCCS